MINLSNNLFNLLKLGDMRQIKDIDRSFTLIQTDFEVKDILESIGNKDDYSYLFVKLDKSGADYSLIYAGDSALIDDYAELVFKGSE